MAGSEGFSDADLALVGLSREQADRLYNTVFMCSDGKRRATPQDLKEVADFAAFLKNSKKAGF